MNNSFKSLIMATTVLVLIAGACKVDKEEDHHHDHGDKDRPVISLTSPVGGTIYAQGDTVHIMGTVTDESLHNLVVKIIKKSDGSELFLQSPTVHDLKSYNIHYDWKNNVTAHTDAQVVVMAEDHSSNVSRDTVNIHCHP